MENGQQTTETQAAVTGGEHSDASESNGNGFDLGKLQQQVVPRDEFNTQISQRDKKIHEMELAQARLDSDYQNKLASMNETMSALQSKLEGQQQTAYQESLRLTEEERDAIGDQAPAVQKIAMGLLSPEQQRINELESQVEALKAGTQTVSKLEQETKQNREYSEQMLDTLSRRTIGLEPLMADESFINYAKSTPYSQFGTRSLWDEMQGLLTIKPGSNIYNSAQTELSNIVTQYKAGNKSDIDTTVQTNGSHTSKPTPQQEKLLNEGKRLRELLTGHLNAGRDKEAYETKQKLEALSVEAKQFMQD